ncbi:MAG: DNA-3-methyladenine glycosylase 2 family protein, partial [Chitinophagaceae bacterium]|nr:DNA-3-methyladenine glycosylase 2 family protein [Chitinophagaceae bacterium]
ADIFPSGDIALINSLKYIKQLPSDTDKTFLLKITETWKPYRTIASFMLWHAYICRKNIVFDLT